ncbi:MAG: threonine/serine exporter family protein [Phycisphaeraceae bacterium]|nr:MAG: threonine/serine exporter family protein [Phycisphaeraceae bacterium]
MTAAEPRSQDTGELLEFLYRLGQAYLACGEQTAHVELLLRRVSTSYGARRPRVVAFPTAIFISLHDGESERVTLAEGPLQSMRLDQMAEVYTLGAEAQRGDITIADGLQRLTEINKRPARFGVVGTLIGHVVLTVGVAMVLNPALVNILVAAGLGGAVGMMKLSMRERPLFSVPLPVVAATVVSTLVFLAVRYGIPVDPLHVLVPPLVTFLPGAMLTFGMIELAYGDMVSGTSRLVSGFVQLVLLTFGLAAGAALAGVGLNATLAPDVIVPLVTSPWIPWVGAMVFGVGVFLHFSAPRNALPWMLLVLLVAFTAQRVSAMFFGNEFSGFFGTLLATPLGYLIQLRFKGPPPMVTFLPSFWLLVPGALGLLSVKQMLSDTAAGVDGLISAVFVFASIALGTLLGASLYKWLTERFGPWQLQIGRSGHKK